MKETSKKAALLLLTSLLCVVMVECAVRALVPVRNVGPSFSQYDPIYGKSLKPSSKIRRVTPEFTMWITTDSEGHRGPEQSPKPRGAVLFLGDSFTMGYGVSDGEEFPALVRDAIAAPVVNMGIGHNGNGRWLVVLRRKAAEYAPSLVVLQVHDNDFEDNVAEDWFRLADDGSLVERPIPEPTPRRSLQKAIETLPGVAHLHLIGLLRQLRLPGGAASEAPASEASLAEAQAAAEALTLRLVDEALTETETRGWPTLVVLADLQPHRLALLQNLLDRRGVPGVVVPNKDERPDLYYDVDGHWKPAGHALTVQLLLGTEAIQAVR